MSILKTGAFIALFTFISRITGLARELVIANFFGTNSYADAVNIAFKFPNLFRRLFAEGALTSAFVPIYSKCTLDPQKNPTYFTSEIFTILSLFLFLFTIVCEIFMPQIVMIIAPGFIENPDKMNLAILLCRITTPYLFFISICALFGGVLSCHKKFGAFAIIPVILNISIILFSFLGRDLYQKSVLVSIGIIAGGLIQLLVMIYSVRKYEPNIKLLNIKDLSDEGKIFLKNVVPATLSNGVTQLNLFISQSIASFIPGSISILSYADRLYQFPLSIIGVCFGVVLLPLLSKLHSAGDNEEVIRLQTNAIKTGLFLSCGAMCGIMTLAHPIIYVVYERGAFTPDDTIKTANTLAIFATGLPAYILIKILTPIFYARLDAKSPMIITIITIITNLILNILLVLAGFEYLGIAIGTSISSWVNVFLLSYFCYKNKIKIIKESIQNFLRSILISCVTMSLFLSASFWSVNNYFYIMKTGAALVLLISIIIAALFLYIITSIFLKIVSINEIKLLTKMK
ncbi:MAG: murein biosynthesis integral membrane protein MurJ [Rickettsiaceae bacterium]|nr:murein biosynthesis integral membrane protein MurJ [Rickettsiaceae bacterium]